MISCRNSAVLLLFFSMFVFSLLFYPIFFIVFRSLHRTRTREGFLFAGVSSLIYALFLIFFTGFFKPSQGIYYTLLNVLIDRMFFPLFLALLLWLIGTFFFSQSFDLAFEDFVLFFLIIPAWVQAIQDVKAYEAVQLFLIPVLTVLLSLSSAFLFRTARSMSGFKAFCTWAEFFLIFAVASISLAAATFYRPFWAFIFILPLLVASVIALLPQNRVQA